MEQPKQYSLSDVRSIEQRLSEIGDVQDAVAALAKERAKIEAAEEQFAKDFLARLSSAAMPITRDGTEFALVRPSVRGEITRVCKLAGEVIFRTSTGKVVLLTEHVDYKLFLNRKGGGLDRKSFAEAENWLEGLINEVDMAA